MPVSNKKYRPITLTPTAGASTTFTTRYISATPQNHTNISGPGLNHISGGYVDGGGLPNTNTGYYWDIQSDGGGKDAKLSIAWTSQDTYGTDGNSFSTDITPLTFAGYDGTDWSAITSTVGGLFNNGSLETFSEITNFADSLFTLGSTDATLYLPIDLVSFEGECIDNKTNLEFVVASQVNNDYFAIKRSTNNLEWEEVGFINGGGTNNEEITYTWTDHSPKSGVNYYKLFQTDIDGLTKSFSPIAINCESKVEDYHIYPNPTNGIVSVEFDLEYYQGDNIQMVLKDFKGVIVKSYPIELKRGYNNFEVDLNNLPNGFYVLSYSGTKNHIPSKRIVKL